MAETVFILGAGASKEAGAPLMANFLEVADQLRRSGQVADAKEDFDKVFDAIQNLTTVHSKSYIDLDNIESVLGTIEMAQLIGFFPGLESNEIPGLLHSVRRLITRTLEETVKFPTSTQHIHPPSSYVGFVKLISELKPRQNPKRCAIITFNYDLALDYALSFSSNPPNYALPEQSGDAVIPLLKLHGSLNWTRCKNCSAIVPWTFDQFFKRRLYSLEDNSFIKLDLGSRLKTSTETHCQSQLTGEPVIVPPTWNKNEYHSSLGKVWAQAARELSDAENIFVSGYSLPKTDSFFRYLFALGSVGKTRLRRFVVFDVEQRTPSGPVQRRFKELLGPDALKKFEYQQCAFSNLPEWVKKWGEVV